MTNEIYTGYKKYNDSDKIKIEARYSINPENLFDKNIDAKPKMHKENEWLEEYLNINIFKKIKHATT
jgi:hypothetical protein